MAARLRRPPPGSKDKNRANGKNRTGEGSMGHHIHKVATAATSNANMSQGLVFSLPRQAHDGAPPMACASATAARLVNQPRVNQRVRRRYSPANSQQPNASSNADAAISNSLGNPDARPA